MQGIHLIAGPVAKIACGAAACGREGPRRRRPIIARWVLQRITLHPAPFPQQLSIPKGRAGQPANVGSLSCTDWQPKLSQTGMLLGGMRSCCLQGEPVIRQMDRLLEYLLESLGGACLGEAPSGAMSTTKPCCPGAPLCDMLCSAWAIRGVALGLARSRVASCS